jgi:hypothetical protein
VYTELGFQTVQRAGMWIRRPSHELVSGWIERALELAPEGSPLRAKALFAQADWNGDEGTAREAAELAERLGDVELQSFALGALAGQRLAAGDYERACTLVEQRLALLPSLTDPDHIGHAYWLAGDVFIGGARLADALHYVALLDDAVRGLTPHHRVHGVGRRVTIASLGGAWERVQQLQPRVERDVERNLATPCPLNVATLLWCALASAVNGDSAEADRLEAVADTIGMEGYDSEFDPPKLRLALVRNDLAAVRRLVVGMIPEELEAWAYRTRSALFDALVALEDHDRIEADAPEWLRPRTYVEPFAMRALGAVRGDATSLQRAATLFEGIGMPWHAEETRTRFAGRL